MSERTLKVNMLHCFKCAGYHAHWWFGTTPPPSCAERQGGCPECRRRTGHKMDCTRGR